MAKPILRFLLLAFTVLVTQPVFAVTKQTGFPNIIIILADDLGYGDIQSNFTEGRIRTPNIDELGREGIRFTDAHSGASVCSPARYGLLTGQHFSRRPWSSIKNQLFVSMIDDDRLTLGKLLQSRGYNSGAFGKWHLGQTFYNSEGKPGIPGSGIDWSVPSTGGPNDRGFDTFFGVAFGQNHWIHAFMQDRLVTEVPTVFTEEYPAKAAGFSPELVMPETTRKVLEYIDWNVAERPGKPFFIYFAPVTVHLPLAPSKEFIGKSGVGPYGDFVAQLDADVGAVMKRLRHLGIDDNTLVIFTSDNGSHGRAGNRDENGRYPDIGSLKTSYQHRVNGNWRGWKGGHFEGGHRVPFIARWPEKIEPGTVSEQLITLEDIMATVAEIVDTELPTGSAEDSYNILPYLDGSHTGPPIRSYAVFNTLQGNPVLRKDQWVYAFHLATENSDVGQKDPSEACDPCERYYKMLAYADSKYSSLVMSNRVMRSSLNDYPIVRTDQWILALQQQAEQDNANAGGPGLVKPCKSCGHLSNLQKDPRQKRDLSLGQPGIVRGLTDFYQAHIDRGSSFAVDR